MKDLMDSPWLRFFTPAHKRAVDEHLLRDEATTKLIKTGEKLIDHLISKAPGYNQKRSLRRKQKQSVVRLKINHKFIKLQLLDTKYSVSPIQKRITIICYRHYVRAKNGVGICKEASINYMKDGTWHVRSLKQSSLFQGIFFRIHRLDEAFSQGQNQTEGSLELLDKQKELLGTSKTDHLPLLLEESKRFFDSVEQFSINPLIQNRLERLIKQASKLSSDFDLLDYEEKHIVRRMFKEDVPKLLNTFLSLSLKNQLEQKENIFVTLSKMELTLIDYHNQLEKARVEKMNHLIRLQEMRYNRD
ncbi:hypothetical protein [Alkalihalobacillus sp. 1P02AB]|uniref:hypothetical protein n=1 Tax=Alkalihalobacillus sp. 1P02AB TaxID=3132260 RepID=UPI0039A77B72